MEIHLRRMQLPGILLMKVLFQELMLAMISFFVVMSEKIYYLLLRIFILIL
jgi:hypothetical protein